MSYCILPLCSENVRKQIHDDDIVRSILFYGPEGCGKASMAEATASMANALLISISSAILRDIVNDSEDATKFVHMIVMVAKDPSFAPVIIYIDQCEEFFAKKDDQMSASALFMKDLIIYKNQALTRDDRVVIIGSTSKPDSADFKTLKWTGNTGKPSKQGK